MKVTGIDDVTNFFRKYSAKVDAQLDESLEAGAEKILERSNQLAPRDTGEMVRQTDVKKKKDNEWEARYNTDYSLYVHEDLEARHPNGQAKFLQSATNEKGIEVIRDIAKDLGNIKV